MSLAVALTLGGAAKGLGDGIVQEAENRRESALAALKRKQDLADDARNRRWDLQDDARNRGWDLEDQNREWGREDGKLDRAADVVTSLFGTESGGDFDAANDEGYVGRGQFGQSRLDDFSAANGAPRIEKEAFRKNPRLQKAVEEWHFDDIEDFIDQNDLIARYEGKKIKGVLITRSGMVAMAHLGGSKGMRRFLESDGEYDPADSNNTTLSKYARVHGGLSTPRMSKETARVYVDPDTPEDVRDQIGDQFGLGGSKKRKLTNHTWMEDENGQIVRMGYDEEAGGYVPVPGAGGRPPSTSGGARGKISATTSTDIEKLFEDPMTDEIDREAAAVFEQEVARLMVEEDLTDREAYSKAVQGMQFEITSKTTGKGGRFLGIDWNGKETTVEEKGPWLRTFRYGDEDDAPAPRRGLGGGDTPPKRTAPAPAQQDTPAMPADPERPTRREASRGDMPAPKSKAEYDALPSGTRYIDPKGKVRTKT